MSFAYVISVLRNFVSVEYRPGIRIHTRMYIERNVYTVMYIFPYENFSNGLYLLILLKLLC